VRASGRTAWRIAWLVAPCFLLAEVSTDVVVETDQLRQAIDGFGASSAFFSKNISAADAQFLFSEETGIGLSLLRVSIAQQVPVTPEIETAKKAHAWGARVIAAAWTPKPEWKTNGGISAVPNAHLKAEYYPEYAAFLADFAETMRDSGVPLLALTPQNEPDYPAVWDGCLWTPSELVTFIGKHMGPELALRGLDVKIIAPDTANLQNAWSFTDALLSDANAKRYLDGLSTHPYGRIQWKWFLERTQGLPVWMTEFSQERPGALPDPTMASALAMARTVHAHLTELSVSVWNYYNLTAVDAHYRNDGKRKNPALIQDGVRFKRAYALGNFAKFVRPGFRRVEATPEPAPDVLITAFKRDARIVIVAVNAQPTPVHQRFRIRGRLPGTLVAAVPWITSDRLSLEEEPPVAIRDTSFRYALPPRSVTSFVVDVQGSLRRPRGARGASRRERADGAGRSGTVPGSRRQRSTRRRMRSGTRHSP
jgi:glucuronoarabinoxylan endo-1,4-beta-xylanase